MEEKEILLSFKNVDISFGKGNKRVNAVKNATFDIYKGETFSLVGESGSGKTTIGRAVVRLNECSNGTIEYNGKVINGKISNNLKREIKRNIQMIFQDPHSSLNERATIDYIVSEGLYNFNLFKSEEERKSKVNNIMKEVGLRAEHLSRYPHEFSGGQRQRIGIARAMVMEPKLVVADEPISALDVSIRAQVLNLLNKFKKEKRLTCLFIAHDLSIVRYISDRIGVIYKGVIVEIASSEELFNNPIHPYTKSLLSAIPIPDPILEKNKKLYVYDPSIHDYSINKPSLVDIGNNHYVYGSEDEIIRYLKNEDIFASKDNTKVVKETIINEEYKPFDTGSIFYIIVSSFQILIGVILMIIFKIKGYDKNYNACKKGVIYGLLGLLIIALLIGLGLIIVLI